MKRVIILLTLLSCLFLTGCQGNDQKLKTHQKITYQEYQDKIKEKDSFILLIGKTGCPACELFDATIKQVITDHQVKVFYLNTADLTDDEKSDFHQSINYDGTPTTCFIEEGIEKSDSGMNRINGAKDYEYVVNKLKKNGYIK